MGCEFVDITIIVSLLSIKMLENTFSFIIIKYCYDIVKSKFIW